MKRLTPGKGRKNERTKVFQKKFKSPQDFLHTFNLPSVSKGV